jgi:hypothetical protein
MNDNRITVLTFQCDVTPSVSRKVVCLLLAVVCLCARNSSRLVRMRQLNSLISRRIFIIIIIKLYSEGNFFRKTKENDQRAAQLHGYVVFRANTRLLSRTSTVESCTSANCIISTVDRMYTCTQLHKSISIIVHK